MEPKVRSAFVISPIGGDGSATREHADDVFDYIIKPAMDQCGIRCRRADHMNEPGKLTEQMFREISSSDVCVALLTERNPNVYYELALAQAWNRPVIILIEREEELPFDIRDLRCMAYDLKPRNLFDKVHVNQLVAHLKTLEQMNWTIRSPFQFIPQTISGTGDDGAPEYFERYSRFGSSDVWVDTVAQTEQRCDILSISLDSWKNRTGFTEQLLALADRGCQVRLMQMHHENPMLNDFGMGSKAANYIKLSITIATTYLEAIASKSPNITLRSMHSGCLHNRLIILDESAFLSPYMYGNTSSPLWRCKKGTSFYETVCSEFETLWKINEPLGTEIM